MAIIGQFMRFGTVGAVGFVVDTSVVYATRGALGLYLAGVVSFLCAATVTWIGNRIWTFRTTTAGGMKRQWMLFLAANSSGFLLNRGTYAILVTISPLCAREPVFAIMGGVAMGMFLNFHLSRRIVFR